MNRPSKNATCATSPLQRSVRLLPVLLAALPLSGCLVTTTTIEGENTKTFLPAVRASLNLNGTDHEASEIRTGDAIELGYMSKKISSEQTLSSGQLPVIHNGTTFTSPQQLRNDFNFSFADISWRRREFLNTALGLEFSAGVGYSSLDLAVSSPTQHAAESYSNTGVQLGIGFIYLLSPGSSIHAGAVGYSSFDYGVRDVTRYEAYYAKALHKNISLRAGYADYKVDGRGHEGMSSFHLHFAGPTLVLEGSFNLSN